MEGNNDDDNNDDKNHRIIGLRNLAKASAAQKQLNVPSLLYFLIYRGFLEVSFSYFLHFRAKMKEKWKKLWSKNVSSSDILAWTAELTNPGEQ